METRYTPPIEDVSPGGTEDVPVKQYFNKATGSEINPTRLGIIQNGTSGVSGGDIFFHLNADDNGNISFTPQWSPRAHGFLRDSPVGQAIMAIGSIIPSPIQPFVMAAKGADTLAHATTPLGYLSGLASLAGAGLTGAGLIGGPDIVGSDWAAGAPTTGLGNTTLPIDVTAGSYLSALKDVTGGLKTATTGTKVINSLQQGNLGGAVNALTSNPNLAGGLGSTPIGGTGFSLGDVGNAAGLAANLASGNPNIGTALGSVGSLTGNQDLSTIGKGVSLAQGVMSGKPLSALSSLVGLGGLANAGASAAPAPIDDRSIQANMGTVDPTAYLQNIPSGYSDVGLGGYDNFDLSNLASTEGIDPTASLQTIPTSYSGAGLGDTNAAPEPTQFDTSAFTDSTLQQPASPGLTATNVSGTTAMGDDWNLDEDIPSYDLSQYINGLDLTSGPLGGETPPAEVSTAPVVSLPAQTISYPVDPFEDIAPPPGYTTQTTSEVSPGLDSSWGDTPDRPTGVGPLAVWSPTTEKWEEKDDTGNTLTYDRSGNLLGGSGSGYDQTGKAITGTPQKLTGIASTTPAKAAAAATTPTKTAAGAGTAANQGTGLGSLLPLLLMMYAASQSKGSSSPASSATIPALTATQTQTPYTSQTQAPTYRPGQGGINYFNPVQYTPKMAAGGIAGLGAAKGRLLDGSGDGVSDSIPATIGSKQPARLARGEFVVDARTVAELGNGSTNAGADKLLNMMQRVHKARKKVGRGEDSHADRYLPA
jgi:hypothetical protein